MPKRKRSEQQPSSSSSSSTSSSMVISMSAAEKAAVQQSVERKMKERTKEERRLDSLARLFEGDSTCAAVCCVNDEVLITNNKIRNPAGGIAFTSTDAVLVSDTLQHFIKCTSLKSAMQDRNDDYQLLIRICKQKIKAMNQSLQGDTYNRVIQVDDGTLLNIIKFLYHEKSQQNYITKREGAIAACLSSDKFELWETSRGLDLSQQDIATRRKIILLSEEIKNIENTYHAIWWIVRDYKKSKRFIKENKIKQGQILAIGADDEHAEMRMMGYLLETNNLIQEPKQPIYVGISKLCCAHCSAAIHSMNSFLSQESRVCLMFEDEKRNEEFTIKDDEIPKHIEDQIEVTAEECAQKEKLEIDKQEEANRLGKEEELNKGEEIKIETVDIIRRAGSHGLSFNWKAPCYLENKRYLLPPGYIVFPVLSLSEINKNNAKKGEIYIVKHTGEYMVRHPNGKTLCRDYLSDLLKLQLQSDEINRTLEEDILSFLLEKEHIPSPASYLITASSKHVEKIVSVAGQYRTSYNQLNAKFVSMKNYVEDALANKVKQKCKQESESQKSLASVNLFHSYSASDVSSPASQAEKSFVEDLSDLDEEIKVGELVKSSLRDNIENKADEEQKSPVESLPKNDP